jgi:hypothetical protein
MHPEPHQLAQAQIAHLHRQAQRDALARAARGARRASGHPGTPRLRRLPALITDRMLTVLRPAAPNPCRSRANLAGLRRPASPPSAARISRQAPAGTVAQHGKEQDHDC